MHASILPTRASLLREIDQTALWDVVVIGGGASGLGTAVDAASRGYRTLLVEARDFAKGTSSKATKLVHGGVRYLAQGNVPLVREALRERGLLARNAPHLVSALGFIVPAYRLGDKLTYGAGLKLYDLLAGKLNLAASRSLNLADTRAASPMLAGTLHGHALRGGTLYFDGQFDDARLAVTLMRTLFDLGGIALNNLAVRGVQADDGHHRLTLEDAETGDALSVRARCIVNAAGVWVDSIRAMANSSAQPIVAPSQGVHLTLPGRFLRSEHAILVPKTKDGRVLFVVPWHGHTIVGTTDTPRHDLPLDPRASDEDIDFILATAADYLSMKPTRDDVLSVWAGLRPLVKGHSGNGDAATKKLSREHHIELSAPGMITVTGGKWTTYRLMAQQVLDFAVHHALLPAAPCRTASLPLHGSTSERGGVYGADAHEIALLPGASRVLIAASGLTEAHARFAVRAEMARGVEDVLARRNRALFLDAAAARAAAPEVARIVAEEMGKSAQWQADEIGRFDAFARTWMLR